MGKAEKPSIEVPQSHQKGRPNPRLQQQRARFKGHDHEGGQRDRDNVGADAVEARAMEMVERERHQRDLDRKARSDDPEQGAKNPRDHAFLAPLQQPPRPAGRMKRDDRGHRGKAHLEARSGNRLRTEDQHDQRAGRDQPDTERIAPKRNPAEDQERGDAAPHRRHLHAGQKRVTDARGRSDRSGHQHEVEPQRQRLAQRQEPQGQQHGEGDHRGDVQSADREQMREAAAPHRVGVVLVDRVLVAGHKRDGDPGRIRR